MNEFTRQLRPDTETSNSDNDTRFNEITINN